MGCGSNKNTQKNNNIFCSFHPKLFAESLCFLSDCASCKIDNNALCSTCTNKHSNQINESKIFYLQSLSQLTLSLISYYKYYVDESGNTLSNLTALEHLIKQKNNSQITIPIFLNKIYVPCQEMIRFSYKLIEEEKSCDYEMINAVGINIGSINRDGKVLDEASSIKHHFCDNDSSIRNSKNIVIGYYYKTGLFTTELNKKIGMVHFMNDGALVHNEREIVIGRILKNGEVQDNKNIILGNCKANPLKVAYEYFFT